MHLSGPEVTPQNDHSQISWIYEFATIWCQKEFAGVTKLIKLGILRCGDYSGLCKGSNVFISALRRGNQEDLEEREN